MTDYREFLALNVFTFVDRPTLPGLQLNFPTHNHLDKKERESERSERIFKRHPWLYDDNGIKKETFITLWQQPNVIQQITH